MNSPCDRRISRRNGIVRHVSEALEPRVLLAAQLVKHFDTALALGPHIGDTLYFRDGGGDLWKSDGSSAGTLAVAGDFGAQPVATDNRVFSRRYDTSVGEELWVSDGTAAGSVLVRDIATGGEVEYEDPECHGEPDDEICTGGGNFFFGNSSSPEWLTPSGETLFFSAFAGKDDNDTGVDNELWRSDGTKKGTVLVRDIKAGEGSSNPTSLIDVDGTLFFDADDGVHGRELWRSDGTKKGTVLVKDFVPGSADGLHIDSPANVNGTLFFTKDATQLWKSDGTKKGTVLVRDLLDFNSRGSFNELVNVNGTLFFTVSDLIYGRELWRSDGTKKGTVLVKDIDPGIDDSDPSGLTNVNGVLYFSARDGRQGTELFRSDGTKAGTVRVKDILTGPEGSFPSNLTDVNGTLYFAADDGIHGRDLWSSDGTSGGTRLVQEILPGSTFGLPSQLMNVQGTLFFTADNGGTLASDLWTLTEEPS